MSKRGLLTALITFIVRSTGFAAIIFISACSSHIPAEIRQSLDHAPSVAQVHQQPDNYTLQKVRWGGVILHTENKHNSSWLTVVALPLSNRGRPLDSDKSPGRFIAIVDGFLEPNVYNRDRKITVTGNLVRTETLKIGKFPYKYPLIQVTQYYLWPSRQKPTNIDLTPFWYGPSYYPYYSPYPRRYRH
jgi:outer membrane lipoprotein